MVVDFDRGICRGICRADLAADNCKSSSAVYRLGLTWRMGQKQLRAPDAVKDNINSSRKITDSDGMVLARFVGSFCLGSPTRSLPLIIDAAKGREIRCFPGKD